MGKYHEWRAYRRQLKIAKASRRNELKVNWDAMFDGLDDETRQETTLKYLRSLDNTSLKRLIDAVELYRKADKILKEKVKDPEEQKEGIAPATIEPELTPIVGKEDE